MRESDWRNLGLATILAVTAACAKDPVKNLSQEDQIATQVAELEKAATQTVESLPSETPTITQTPTETSTPTETPTPTETLPNYQLCTDWSEASQCPIPWEDIKKGVPGRIARLTEEAFPNTAYNTGNIQLVDEHTFDSTFLSWNWGSPEDTDYRSKPETRPYRWVGFFSTRDENGKKYIGAVQQWLNPSGRTTFLTYIDIYFPLEISIWKKMAVGWPWVDFNSVTTRESCPFPSNICDIVLDKETNLLLHKWQETGEIPEELEMKAIVPFVSDGDPFVTLTP